MKAVAQCASMAQSETTQNAALQLLAELAKSNPEDTIDVTLQVHLIDSSGN